MTRPRGLTLTDYIRELTEPHQHREPYTVRGLTGGTAPRTHVTRVPALLVQLWDAPSNAAETGASRGFESRPTARLDALDTAARIDVQAARWITDLGEQPRSLRTADVVLQLHGLVPSADLVQRKAITASVRSWWLQARIVTGWDSPAWSPNTNTCPQCGERGTLKVRFAERIAMCTNDPCLVTWDETTIGLLAEHIRVESEGVRVRDDPWCYCPYPEPRIPDLRWQCRRCGSARCRHALWARLLAELAERSEPRKPLPPRATGARMETAPAVRKHQRGPDPHHSTQPRRG